MDLQRPVMIGPAPYMDPDAYAVNLNGFGAGDAGCSKITWVIVGAVGALLIPPFVSGLFTGARQAYDER